MISNLTSTFFNYFVNKPEVNLTAPLSNDKTNKAKKLFHILGDLTPMVKMLQPCEVIHRFTDIACPSETAKFHFNGNRLHANEVCFSKTQGSHQSLCKHIATQAPLDKTWETFWGVAYENSEVIIDLTQPHEIEAYYPIDIKQGAFKAGNISVTCKSKVELPNNIVVCQYEVRNKGSNPKIISRIHYTGWVDQAGTSPEDLEKVLEVAGAYHKDPKTPMMIHCRAGVGRTGTCMVAFALKEMHRQGLLHNGNKEEVIKSLILEARQQRGPLTVQKPEQLSLLLQYADELIKQAPSTNQAPKAAQVDNSISLSSKISHLCDKLFRSPLFFAISIGSAIFNAVVIVTSGNPLAFFYIPAVVLGLSTAAAFPFVYYKVQEKLSGY